MSPRPFADSTAVERVEPGRYRAHIDDDWVLRPLPQGGVVTALALRAMAAELDDPDQHLRTLTTLFVGQVAHGPVSVAVDVLRRGRTVSHMRAEVANDAVGPGHVTTAAFGAPRRGFDLAPLAAPPAVPPPSECESVRDHYPADAPYPPMPFWEERVECRVAQGHLWTEPHAGVERPRVMWYRMEETPRLEDGTVDPLALVTIIDTMPGAVGERIGHVDVPWFAPSVDLTVHLFAPCRSEWVLADNHVRHAGDGYASVEMSLWDCGPEGADPPTIVAYATQLCLFSFLG